ncbi:hypothetical protein IKE88_02395 [Candidatus Saccharibacteria bacterium]|nr:hypothetical protein [Candidatus Saccharibacteria bacterium]
MDWNFSFGWFFVGVLILIAGTLVTVFYQKISDNMASGISSYERVKLIGVITAIVGFTIMANLHTLILSFLVDIVFSGFTSK